jgi:PBP1b-binding outer membrane lipoprotein LpoB
MIKKITILIVSALLLGGCTLSDIFKPNQAVSDQKSELSATQTPLPVSSVDPNLEAMPSTSTSTDTASLEIDIESTKILEEDFSDLN